MGQIFSYVWNRLYSKPRNQTPKDDHHQVNYQSISLLDDETTYRDQLESHCINIPSHFQPLLDDETTYRDQLESHCINIPAHFQPIISSSSTTISGNNNDNGTDPSTPPHIVVDLKSATVVSREDAWKKQKKKKKKRRELVVDHIDKVITEVLEKNVTTTINHVPVVSRDNVVRRIGLYNSGHRILLVGEGDFSFSACLAVAFGTSAVNLTATSLNSQDFLVKNYGKFLTNKAMLESRGSTILHDVDATKMVKHPLLNSVVYDRIIFNFPHAGKFGHSDSELRGHKNLVRGFLRNAKKMITEDGEIHITSKSNGFYLGWDIPKIGSDQGLHLIEELKFNKSKYPGYNTKYGFGGDRDFECNPSKTYKFRLSQN